MTTQDSPESSNDPNDRLVKVFESPTASEALVVRGLLKSAGIFAPDFDAADPFPMNESPQGWRESEVWVPESQAEDARRILAEYSAKSPGAAE